MPRRSGPRAVHVSQELKRVMEKYIPSDDWVDLVDTVPGVVFGIDLAAPGGEFTAVFTPFGVKTYKPKAPPMRNVTPPKPKLLKESNE